MGVAEHLQVYSTLCYQKSGEVHGSSEVQSLVGAHHLLVRNTSILDGDGGGSVAEHVHQ